MTETTSTTPAQPGHATLAEALAAFQAAMPTVPKNKRATIPGKDGRAGYSYQYADLADLVVAAAPLLSAHGLSFFAAPRRVEGTAQYELAGVLLHRSGDREEGSLPLTGRTPQEIGSSITYARRYLLGCLSGIVTDEDDDGRSAPAERLVTAPPPAEPPTEEELLGDARAELWDLVKAKLPGKDRTQIMLEVESSAAALNPPGTLNQLADVRRLIDVWKD